MTDPSIAGTHVPDTTERSWTSTLGWAAPVAGIATLLVISALVRQRTHGDLKDAPRPVQSSIDLASIDLAT